MPACMRQRAIDWVQNQGKEIDFCLCVGDDTSDELMFKTLNEQTQVRTAAQLRRVWWHSGILAM